MKKERKLLDFRITYFTMRGKCYLRVTYSYESRIGEEGDPDMRSITAHIRGLANDDSQHSGLPGLDGYYWAGPIMVEQGGMAPVLITPDARTHHDNKAYQISYG